MKDDMQASPTSQRQFWLILQILGVIAGAGGWAFVLLTETSFEGLAIFVGAAGVAATGMGWRAQRVAATIPHDGTFTLDQYKGQGELSFTSVPKYWMLHVAICLFAAAALLLTAVELESWLVAAFAAAFLAAARGLWLWHQAAALRIADDVVESKTYFGTRRVDRASIVRIAPGQTARRRRWLRLETTQGKARVYIPAITDNDVKAIVAALAPASAGAPVNPPRVIPRT